MDIKKPNVANMFYPGDKNELKKMLNDFFKQIHVYKKTGLKAVVSPHAGYIYSGLIAAYSYKSMLNIWEEIKSKTIVLLCPTHYLNFNKVSVGLFDEFETPLGNIKVDKVLGEKLVNEYPNYFTQDLTAFDKEHSLEVQLPFLKYISGNSDFKILPLIFGQINYIDVGKILNELLKTKDLFFIVSSDLSHYKDYKNAEKIDNTTIKAFLKEDVDNIIYNADACGIYPWITLNEIAKNNNWNSKLIKYLNSGDTAGDKDKVVGYSSIIYL